MRKKLSMLLAAVAMLATGAASEPSSVNVLND